MGTNRSYSEFANVSVTYHLFANGCPLAPLFPRGLGDRGTICFDVHISKR